MTHRPRLSAQRRSVAIALLLLSGCAAQGDVPLRSAHRWFTSYERLAVPLFAGGQPSPYDVHQGEVGSCWLLAAMAATAAQQPEMIRAMFTAAAEQSYRVAFNDPAQRVVTVTTAVPFRWFASQPLYAGAQHAAWASLLEKAYAKAFEPQQGYEGIGGDHPRLALARLTGWKVRDYDIDGDLSRPLAREEWDWLRETFRRGAPMVAGSRIAQLRADIVPMHAYAITAIEGDDSASARLRLYDPEGLNAYPNSELALDFAELTTSFFYVSVALPAE